MPTPMEIALGTNADNTAVVGSGAALPVENRVNGTAVSSSNPNPVNVEQVGGVAVDNDEPAPVTPAPFTTPTTTQVALSTTVGLIVAQDGTRRRLFFNCAAAAFIGPSGVAASGGTGGFLLSADKWFESPTPTAAHYGIVASGTPAMTVLIVKD